MDQWTDDDVRKILTNPLYTGVGPFPKIVDDALWVEAAKMMIASEGLEAFLQSMLKALRESFSESK